MIIGEWQAQLVVDPPGVNGAVLYLYRRVDGQRNEFLTSRGEISQVERNGIPVGSDLSFAVLEPEQLKAIAEAFSKSGVKTVNEHKAQGLLEAKESHLQDMRALVFKGKQQV